MEAKLLATCGMDKDSHYKLHKLGVLDTLGPQGKIVYQELDDYYSLDRDCIRADWDVISARVLRKYERHKNTLETYISKIRQQEPSVPNILHDFIELKRRSLGIQISSALLAGDNPKELMDEYLTTEVSTLAEDTGTEDRDIYHLYDIRDCINDIATGIKLYPEALNAIVGGGLQKGNHVVITARPEAGKSLFAINFSYGFCNQGLRTLYCGNEDTTQSMGERFLSRFTELTRHAMQQLGYSEVMAIAINNGYDNLYFAPMSPGSPREIKYILDKYGPFDCLVVDQLRNLDVGGDNKVIQLERAAIDIRYIAKKYALLAVSVTQAGNSAENKLVLDLGDIDYSNTGIPAMADVLIGIGSNAEYASLDQRMVTYCKNKITGEHSSVIVNVDRSISKVLD